MDNKNLINNLQNSCWFWSSVYIIEKYVENNGVPKELSNNIIKQLIETKNFHIEKYDNETMKQSDITNNLDGNAVEFLTVNGFYYTSCIPVRKLKDPFAELQINGELPFAFLIQLPGHYMSIILEDNDYYLYDRVGELLNKAKLNFDKEKSIIKIPINPLYSNIYVFNKNI